MDPRIASGFSILGNALMPDPARLAQAEVLRSQMLQNQAQTGKLTAETETIRRTAEQLALLQDLLANPASTSNDIISRGVGAGITTNPANIPQLYLGAESVEGLDINDPESFSKALLGTGTVASQAATPSGFTSDQARQEREAVAKDITTQRGQDITSTDTRYNTDVDAQTALDTQAMKDQNDLEIADITRSTQLLTNARDRATQTLIAAKDRASKTGDNRETLAAEKVLDDLDREADALKARLDRAAAVNKEFLDRQSSMAEVLTQQEGAGARAESTANIGAQNDIDVANIQAKSAAEVARIREGGGAGGGVPKISPAAYRDFQGNVARSLAIKDASSVDMANGKVRGISEDDWLALANAAFQLYPNSDPERIKFVNDVLKLKNGKWRFNKKVFNALTIGADEEEPTTAVTGDTGVEATAAATPEMGTGAVEQTGKAVDADGKSVPIYLENGVWYYQSDNTPVPGQ